MGKDGKGGLRILVRGEERAASNQENTNKGGGKRLKIGT